MQKTYRQCSFVAIALALMMTPLPAEALSIKQVYHGYKEGDAFRRISEYFTGKKNSDRRFITLTRANDYGGYYFIIKLDKPARTLPPGSQVEVAVIVPGKVKPQVYTVTVPRKKSRSHEIYAGITGQDWPDAKKIPTAWRIAIHDAHQAVLAQSQSFLWNDDNEE